MKKLSLFLINIFSLALLSQAYFALPARADLITPNELLPPKISETSGLGAGDIRLTMARIIRVAMGLLGIVAVVIVLLGGFIWMTAGGNEEKVGEAKKFLYSGAIGLAIILSAYAIASFVITQLVYATTSAEGTLPGAF
ncbi:MAG: pilin [Candidatus Magasanikbacteria bacterium]|nr:pilin [Candidatus Magasanikbacteria bacterium]